MTLTPSDVIRNLFLRLASLRSSCYINSVNHLTSRRAAAMFIIGRRRAATPIIGRRRHRHLYLGAVAVVAALLGAFGSAANAMAAVPGLKSASGPGSVSASRPGPTSRSGAGFAITGTVPGTDTACTSNWKWKVDTTLYNWSEVEWTSNPCGYQIQDRSWCLEGYGAYYDSGIVKSTYLWDKATCQGQFSYAIWEADQRFRLPGGSWSAWKTYWGGP